MRRPALLAVAAVLVAAAALLVARAGDDRDDGSVAGALEPAGGATGPDRSAPATAAASSSSSAGSSPGEGGGAPPPASSLEAELARARSLVEKHPLPGSLEGTTPDGQLTVDEHGNLVLDLELRRLFDYFLSATGEEPVEVMRARIVLELGRLPERAAAQGIAALDRYLAYREAGRASPAFASSAAPSGPADLRERLGTLHELRREQLGDDLARAFFAQEEAAADEALAGRSRREKSVTGELAQEEARLRQAGAGEAEIRRLREERVGVEAARRLEELDRQRARWSARVDAFRRQRDELKAAPGLSEAEKREAIERLARGSFAPHEVMRLGALGELR